MQKILTLILIVFAAASLKAQIVLTPLSENAELISKAKENKALRANYDKNEDEPLHLPFIDDFSKYHQPGADKVFWANNHVFVNPTLGVDPPTIGVASFEALDENGYPYNFENSNAYGGADTLTSCLINLSQDENGDPYFTTDNIYLSFYYQAAGLGDQPEAQDSLILEFYISETDEWIMQWSSQGQALSDFEQVWIAIDTEEYLSPDFRFRFRNKATLSGALDHWHIDVVQLDKNRNPSQVGFQDVGFQFPVNKMLNTYTSIPYHHYQQDQDGWMMDEVNAELRNNNAVAVNLSGVKMRNFSEGMLVNTTPFPGTINNFPAESSDAFAIPLANAPYEFDASLADPFVSFRNEFVMTSGTFDLISDNDSIEYIQEFRNYYSYDDGSAEVGIGGNTNGTRMVVKYSTNIPDSLIGFSIFFNPVYEQPVFPFLMLVLDDEDEAPGDLIHINQGFSTPNFVQEGHNIFSYYWLDSAVYVEGDYYIGVAQTSNTSLNIGFDRNINTNDKIWRDIGQGYLPLSPSIEGSLMMRPVFSSDMDSVILGLNERKEISFAAYPNPANDVLRLQIDIQESVQAQLWSLDGRLIEERRFAQYMEWPVDHLPEGMYLLRVISSNAVLSTEKIMISR